MRNLLIRIFILCAAAFLPLHTALAADDFLPPEQAFAFSARMADSSTIEVRYRVADGYYLYRDKFAFAADGASLGSVEVPRGKVKFDPNFEKDVETMRGELLIRVPVQTGAVFTLKVTSQGCSDKGLCYPPMTSEAHLSAGTGSGVSLAERLTAAPAASTPASTVSSAVPPSDIGRIEASLASGRLVLILPLFLLLGLGLSFTPCVLPMVPILSFIIAGEGTQTNRRRAFALSVSYSLGMAVVYTALGIAAGLVGEGLSAALQSPLILGSFALLMTAMALSMFDVYQLQMPASVQLALTRLSERQSAGKFAGVFAMGAISALIVGPCVAAPLAGALVYISQTRDVFIGGSALFAMAAGMSVPLLLVGLSAGSLLPRAGAWMQSVKIFFGILMLALALWMVASLIPAWLLMLGWGVLGAGYGVFLLRIKSLGWRARVLGVAFMLLASIQLVGVASGGRDPWSPLAHLFGKVHAKTAFARISSNAELDAALAQADGRRVMLDFYADWCVSCIEMEKFTFVDAKIKPELDQLLLLQADVTANNEEHKALLKRFGLFGPPGIIFFGADGREIPGSRVIGFQSADAFLQSLQRTK
jgi:thiol:disulfide interchange protein DsbD